MKQFTITYQSDEHCEALARRRGWTDQVRNPEWVNLPADVNNPDYDPSKEISETNPRRIPNPDLKPEIIPNPETHEGFLCRLMRDADQMELKSIANKLATEDVKTTVDSRIADFLAKGEVTGA